MSLVACGGGDDTTQAQHNTIPQMLISDGIDHDLILGQENNTLPLATYFNDADGDVLSYQLLGTDLDVMISGASLTFGSAITAGVYDVQVIALDEQGAQSQPLTIKLNVINPAIPGLTVNGANKAYLANEVVTLAVKLGEESNYPLSYSWVQETGQAIEVVNTDSATLEFSVPGGISAQAISFKLALESDYASYSESVNLAVYSPLVIDTVDTVLTAFGERVRLTISGGNNNSLNFTSSDEMIAKVDQNGEITPLNAGVFALRVAQESVGLFPALNAEVSLVVADPADLKIYLDVPLQVTNGVSSFVASNAPAMGEGKDTSLTTFAKVKFDDKERITELENVDGVWSGVLLQVPADKLLTLTTYSVDFAGQETYQQFKELTLAKEGEQKVQVQQVAVEAESIVLTPIDRCDNYVDDRGNIYPISMQESIDGSGARLQMWGYEIDQQFIRHHDCQPAYIQYFISGNLSEQTHFLYGVNHNNGQISYRSYYDALDASGEPIKKIESREDENGHSLVLDDQPSTNEYYPSGRIRVKQWTAGAAELFVRAFGPDLITYADDDASTYSSMAWHDAEQTREKEKVFNPDGSPQWCSYLDPNTKQDVLYTRCEFDNGAGDIKTELDLDHQYGIDINAQPIIEPIDECQHFIDEDGTVYPIQQQTDDSGNVTTGYVKNGQYTYHNQCAPAMTRFYASGNPEHAWTFRKGINTDPDSYTSFAYYDLLDEQGKPILEMESKIENELYVIQLDAPSVVKYFTNGDIQYQAWMLTNDSGDWVYGRDAGPDVITYGYGTNGYQQKSVYWYSETGHRLKRKDFDSEGELDICHYYQLDQLVQSDETCLNESELDIEFEIQ
ncbi:hypothetical protein TUM4445_08570 [Shewanella sp. MBTL60-112-B2]|nr:hypothetical protein TUM4444_36820 [Shewanella sp. MBTL60-112-B1]GIU27938.1 hypothetical protein TUM4445_08570 [Shewanella sp. MBTL60-112-B2]